MATSAPAAAAAAAPSAAQPAFVLGIPVDFILFGLTLLGVAIFHHKTLQIALTGLAAIVVYKLAFTGFKTGPGLSGLALHMRHEAVVLAGWNPDAPHRKRVGLSAPYSTLGGIS